MLFPDEEGIETPIDALHQGNDRVMLFPDEEGIETEHSIFAAAPAARDAFP